MNPEPQTALLCQLYTDARAVYQRVDEIERDYEAWTIGDLHRELATIRDRAEDVLDAIADLDVTLDEINADEAKRLHDEHLQYVADQADAASL